MYGVTMYMMGFLRLSAAHDSVSLGAWAWRLGRREQRSKQGAADDLKTLTLPRGVLYSHVFQPQNVGV